MSSLKKLVAAGVFIIVGLIAVWFYSPLEVPSLASDYDSTTIEVEMYGDDWIQIDGEQKEKIIKWYESLKMQRRIFMPYKRGRESRYRINLFLTQHPDNGESLWVRMILWSNTVNECEITISDNEQDHSFIIINGKDAVEGFMEIISE